MYHLRFPEKYLFSKSNRFILIHCTFYFFLAERSSRYANLIIHGYMCGFIFLSIDIPSVL